MQMFAPAGGAPVIVCTGNVAPAAERSTFNPVNKFVPVKVLLPARLDLVASAPSARVVSVETLAESPASALCARELSDVIEVASPDSAPCARLVSVASALAEAAPKLVKAPAAVLAPVPPLGTPRMPDKFDVLTFAQTAFPVLVTPMATCPPLHAIGFMLLRPPAKVAVAAFPVMEIS